MITLQTFTFNELAVNSFVLFDETKSCVIIDPACNTPDHQELLAGFVRKLSLKPEYILNTHGHFDHLLGNSWARSLYPCPLLMHKDDLPLVENADKYGGLFGFRVGICPLPDGYIQEGDIITFGLSKLKAIHVPGHSSGSLCFYAEKEGLLVCGDVLFKGSIGRTDLPGGDHNLLIKGILEKLMILPRETVVWPGHGPKTTIGHEYDTNPFLH